MNSVVSSISLHVVILPRARSAQTLLLKAEFRPKVPSAVLERSASHGALSVTNCTLHVVTDRLSIEEIEQIEQIDVYLDDGANGDEHAVAGVHSEDDQAGDDHGGHAEQDQHGDRGRHAVSHAGARGQPRRGTRPPPWWRRGHPSQSCDEGQEDAVEDEADHLGHSLVVVVVVVMLFHSAFLVSARGKITTCKVVEDAHFCVAAT